LAKQAESFRKFREAGLCSKAVKLLKTGQQQLSLVWPSAQPFGSRDQLNNFLAFVSPGLLNRFKCRLKARLNNTGLFCIKGGNNPLPGVFKAGR
jgi:hypothetical protein